MFAQTVNTLMNQGISAFLLEVNVYGLKLACNCCAPSLYTNLDFLGRARTDALSYL